MSVDPGVDLDQMPRMDTHVRCEWPKRRCEAQAVWAMIQRHLRPPLACLRVPLCTEHRQDTLASERRFHAGRPAHAGPVVCTIHIRPVEPWADWERL